MNKKNKLFYLDFFRGLAIVLMFITHSFRLFYKGNPSLDKNIFTDTLLFFMQVEPFTSAAFLFIAGFSLAIFLDKTKNFKEILKKSFLLYVISGGLFIFSKGIQPQIFYNSGILSVISFSLITSCFLYRFKIKAMGLLVALISSISLFSLFYFEKNGIVISGLNSGPGGILPVFLFSYFGLVFGKLRDSKNFNKLIIFAAVILSPFFLIDYPWIFVNFEKYISFSSFGQYISDFSSLNLTAKSSYWYHSSIGFVKNLFIVLTTLIGLIKFEKYMKKDPLSILVSRLGTVSLWAYVMHLSIIGLMYFLKIYPRTGIECFIFVGILISISYGYSLYKIRKKLLT